MVSTDFLSSAFSGGAVALMAKTMIILGWILLGLAIIAFMWGIYVFIQYKYKVIVFEKRGDGIGKISRWERAREMKHKDTTKWRLLWRRKWLKPLTDEYVYPGNNVFLFKIDTDTYVPFKTNVGNPHAEFNLIPEDISFWAKTELKQAALDYQPESVWNRYGSVMVMAGTVLFCLILVGVTVWLTYQYSANHVGAIEGLSNNFKASQLVEGIAPG